MANDLNRSIKIYIDGSDATQGIGKVETSIAKLEAKLAKLSTGEADYEAKSKQLKSELTAKQAVLNNYKKKVEETSRVLNNLSGSSYDQLLAVSKQVRREVQSSIPDTQKHTTALEQNRRVTEALSRAQAAMRVEVGSQGSMWSSASGFVNKYIGLAGTAVATITGLYYSMNRLSDKSNNREESKADVEALTGLSKDDISWLEKEAIRLSTTTNESGIRIRQSADQILEAFKLVGGAKPELLNDKEALVEVTEQTLILAATGLDLKTAVDGATLSLNQYGDGADQAARYVNVMAAGAKFGAAEVDSVTDAVKRSGVAASSAGIPIEGLVGTIETLAEKGIKDEVAGTGLKKFFLTLQTGADETNPRIVGLETALDNLQKKQLSAAEIKKKFGEEGFNVASVLINEADKVKYYTQAVTGSSAAVEQATVKSETNAAKLAQAKNKVSEMSIELMNKLTPSITSALETTASWTSKISTSITWLNEHSSTITTLVTAIAGYVIISKAQIIEEKLKFFWQEKVVNSLKGAYTVMLKHPYTVVAAAVLTLIAYMHDMNKELTEAEKLEKTLTDIRNSATDSVINEKTEVEQLLSIARDENKSKAEREEAIRKLNDLSPEYLGNITLEKINTEQATKAVTRYIDSLITMQEIKNAQDRIDELNRQKKVIQDNKGADHSIIEEIEAKAANAVNQMKSSFVQLTGIGNSFTDSWADNVLDKYANKGVNQLRAADREINALNEHTDTLRQKLVSLATSSDNKTEKQAGGSGNVDEAAAKKALKKKLDSEKTLYEKNQSELKEQYLSGNDDKIKTEEKFNAEMERLQLEHLQRSIAIVGAKSQDGIEYQNQINDIKLKQRTAQIQKSIDDEKILYENQQNDLKQVYSSGNDVNLRTEAAYNDAMEQLTIMHLQRTLEIAGLNADQRRAIEQQLLDFKVKCMQDEEKEQKKLIDAADKKKEDSKKREQQRLQQQAEQYRQYGQQIGDTVGQVISGQEDAMQSFADTMIDILFDILSQMIDIEIAKATGVAVGAVSRSAAESFAQPDSVATFGATGAVRAAVLSGLIMGALATAKSALKGLIHKGSSSSSTSNNAETTKTATVQVSQWASGRYDVVGATDKKHYNDIPYIGPAPTGIVQRTSLISENGSELIINSEDLSRLQQHINYPLVIQAINDARRGHHVQQRAEGNYTQVATTEQVTQPSSSESYSTEIQSLIAELKQLMITLKSLKAYVVLRDIKDAQELNDKSTKPFTRTKI